MLRARRLTSWLKLEKVKKAVKNIDGALNNTRERYFFILKVYLKNYVNIYKILFVFIFYYFIYYFICQTKAAFWSNLKPLFCPVVD